MDVEHALLFILGKIAALALEFGEFDQVGLVEIDESTPFSVGSIGFAFEPGQFGGEELVIRGGGSSGDGCFAGGLGPPRTPDVW